MANFQLYTTISVYVDGALLVEEASCQIQRTTNAQEVITVAKGFAGMSPGAPMATITVESAVPSADFELNPGRFMKNLSTCEFTLFGGGHTLTTKGFIVEDTLQHSANAESKLSFVAKCAWEDWQ